MPTLTSDATPPRGDEAELRSEVMDDALARSTHADMRIEHAWLRKLPLALVAALSLLAGCPGELPNKAEFEAYVAAHGDAGAPVMMNEAGTSSGVAGSAPSGACGDVVTRIFKRQMPLARPALSSTDVACVLEWIRMQ